MPISRDEAAHIAALARLDLKPDELDGLARDLARILEYVERIAALDEESGGGAPAPGPEPTPDPERTGTPLRADLVQPSLTVAEALRPAADHDDSFFRVPAVIDRDAAAPDEPAADCEPAEGPAGAATPDEP